MPSQVWSMIVQSIIVNCLFPITSDCSTLIPLDVSLSTGNQFFGHYNNFIFLFETIRISILNWAALSLGTPAALDLDLGHDGRMVGEAAAAVVAALQVDNVEPQHVDRHPDDVIVDY